MSSAQNSAPLACPQLNLNYEDFNCTTVTGNVPCYIIERCFSTQICSNQAELDVRINAQEAICESTDSSASNFAQRLFCHCTTYLQPGIQNEFRSQKLDATANNSTTTLTSSSMASITTTPLSSTKVPAPSGGLSTGEIVGIVIAILVVLIIIAVLVIFALRKVKQRRKNRGCYQPQEEEQKNYAKNLPPLPPPAIEGLI